MHRLTLAIVQVYLGLLFYDVITVWLNIFSYHVILEVMCCFAAAPCGVLIISCGFLPSV